MYTLTQQPIFRANGPSSLIQIPTYPYNLPEQTCVIIERFDMVGLTTAAGLVGFLSEPDVELKVYALKRLDEEIDLLWTEVAGSVGQM